MHAFARSFKSLSVWLTAKPLPEPEPFCARPRAMTGFLDTMSDEQKKLARDYSGEERHGDEEFAH